MAEEDLLIVNISGPDRPGIIAAFTKVLQNHQIKRIDLRKRLVLTYFGDTHAIADLSKVLAEENANIEMLFSQTHHGARSFEMIVDIIGVKNVDRLKSRMCDEGIPLDQVVAIGDGANDSLMLTQAGLGIAYNAKKALDRVANVALSHARFNHVFHLLGITEDDIEEAMSCAAV